MNGEKNTIVFNKTYLGFNSINNNTNNKINNNIKYNTNNKVNNNIKYNTNNKVNNINNKYK